QEVRRPPGRDAALAVGDEHDVAAPVARGAEAAERGGERRLEVRAAAGEVLGDVEGAVLLHLVPLARVQVEGEERRVGGREADEAEEPALAPGDLEECQGDGLRPDLLLALHRPRPVEADDHRPPPALVDAAHGIGEEAALDQPAGEVAAAGSAARARSGISPSRWAMFCAFCRSRAAATSAACSPSSRASAAFLAPPSVASRSRLSRSAARPRTSSSWRSSSKRSSRSPR